MKLLAFSEDVGGKLHHQSKQEMELGKTLENLVSSSTGFLNLHWLLQSLDLMLASHKEVQLELLRLPRASLDSGFVSAFMDDTGKLMEACNLLKLSISAAGRSRIHVKYVIKSLLDQEKESQDHCASKVKKMLHECISELETSGSSHTGSWPLLEELKIIRQGEIKAASKSKRIRGRIPSKASEAKLVSVLALTAVFAAFNGDKAAPCLIGSYQSQRFAPGTPAGRLLEGIKHEAEAGRKTKPAIVLEALCSSLKQILDVVLNQEPGQHHEPEKMKVLVQQVSKKLEYFESGLGIVEEQLQEFFAKLVATRNWMLSTSAV